MPTRKINAIIGRTRTETRCRRLCSLLASFLLLGFVAPARGQEQIDNFATEPQIVLNDGGHHAPVKKVLFTADSKLLISAGEDRVAHVWKLDGDDRGLSRTLRPPIWSGRRGVIESMALTSIQPGGGKGPGLVVAGYGVTSGSGDIAGFRLALGPNDPENPLEFMWTEHMGKVTAVASDPDGRLVASASLDGTVRVRNLATNQTRILTNNQAVADLVKPVGQKPAPPSWTPDVCLAITRSGYVIASGKEKSSTGLLFVWNLNAGDLAERSPIVIRGDGFSRTIPFASNQITAMAVSPDEKTLLVGLDVAFPGDLTDNNMTRRTMTGLFRHDLTNLQMIATAPLAKRLKWTTPLLPFVSPNPRQGKPQELGTVRALTFLGNTYFAAAIEDQTVRQREDAIPNDRTWVQIRDIKNGAVFENVGNQGTAPWNGKIESLAYSGDGKLAFADGDRQAIHIVEVLKNWPRQPGPRPPFPVAEIAADADLGGGTIAEVGFGKDAPGSIVLRRPSAPGQPPSRFLAFNLMVRPLVSEDVADPAQLALRQPTWGGWSIQPLNAFKLQVTPPAGRPAFSLTIPELTLGRWLTYSFIPPAEGHPSPCLAVGCRFGIVIYAFPADADPRLSRFLRGHASEVTSLAPSKDGKWLISGSADQTVRLWTLAGCDTVPAFGATFAQDGQNWVVATVTDRSPSDFAGLRQGDRLVKAFATPDGQNQAPLPIDNALAAALDRASPGRMIEIQYVRGNETRNFTTHKYNDPALSLFIDEQGDDWVLWMPSGYYIPSILGDRKYLGFQVNNNALERRPGGFVFNPAARKPEYVPMKNFEPQLHKPQVIDNLLRTGDVAASILLAEAPNAPPLRLEAHLPPVATVAAPVPPPGGFDTQQMVNLNLDVSSADPSLKLTRLEVFDDGMWEQNLAIDAPNVVPLKVPVNFAISPGTHVKTFALIASNGTRNEVQWSYEGAPVAPVVPPRKPKLAVLAFGPKFDARTGLHRTGFAMVTEAGEALARSVVWPREELTNYRDDNNQPFPVWGGQGANVENASDLLRKIDQLADGSHPDALGFGRFADPDFIEAGRPVDTVVLFLDTHVIKVLPDDTRPSVILGADQLSDPDDPGAVTATELADSLGQLVKRGCRVVVFLDGLHQAKAEGWRPNITNLARELRDARVPVYLASFNEASQPGFFASTLKDLLGGQFVGSGVFTPTGLETALKIKGKDAKPQQIIRYEPAPGTSWDRAPLLRPNPR